MANQAYDWHRIIHEITVRNSDLYGMLDKGDFERVLDHFNTDGRDPFNSLAGYLVYGAAAVLGRQQQAAEKALAYHSRLNDKTKAITLFFWSEEAIGHLQYNAAESFLKSLLAIYPKDPEINAMMATCCLYRQSLARGWPHLKTGLESAPDHIVLNARLAQYHLGDGNFTAAVAAARRLLTIDPNNQIAFSVLSRLIPEDIEDAVLAHFERLAGQALLKPRNTAGLFFDIGRIYDVRGDHAVAFDAIERANNLMKQVQKGVGDVFDECEEYTKFRQKRDLLERLQPLERPGSLTPVFIVGLPRSGSTLLDQALAAHPDTTDYGENLMIPEIVDEAEAMLRAGDTEGAQAHMPVWQKRYLERGARQAPDARFVIDKTLGNSRHLGFLKKLFPDVMFLHCRRNFMDVGMSIYFAPLLRTNTYATDLTAIASFIAVDARIIDEWADAGLEPLGVSYESMVDDTKGTLERVFAHIGLSWHDDCLHFHKKKRAVHTHSAHQVRKPIYKSSKGRWRNYAAQLAPLQASLQSRNLTERND